jgi:hypothetical protein
VTLGVARARARPWPRASTVVLVSAAPADGGVASIAGRAPGMGAVVGSAGDCGIGRSVAVTTGMTTARRWVALLRIVPRNRDSDRWRVARGVEPPLQIGAEREAAAPG